MRCAGAGTLCSDRAYMFVRLRASERFAALIVGGTTPARAGTQPARCSRGTLTKTNLSRGLSQAKAEQLARTGGATATAAQLLAELLMHIVRLLQVFLQRAS